MVLIPSLLFNFILSFSPKENIFRVKAILPLKHQYLLCFSATLFELLPVKLMLK